MEQNEVYENTKNVISAFAFVHPSVIMGTGNVIREGAIICEGVQMGNNNYVGPGCIIGDYPEKIGYFDKFGSVVIGNGNQFRKQVTIDSGTDSITVVYDNVIMLKNAHVGHDACIENDVVLSCNVCIGGHTRVGHHTNFGMGAVAHQRLIIPSSCMIGMNSTITKRVQMAIGCKYIGSPARYLGPNIK
jgi:UDP-N-acetylglucosamine acyltransferase